VWNRDWGKMNADCDKFASCKTTPFSGALGYVQLFTATTIDESTFFLKTRLRLVPETCKILLPYSNVNNYCVSLASFGMNSHEALLAITLHYLTRLKKERKDGVKAAENPS
jgi:hypothetical protein